MMMMQSPNQLFYLCLVVVACCTMAPATVVDAVKFNRYAGYLPTTRITDEASIDMDQYDFNLQLSSRRTDKAMYVYREGGHSGSYALLNLLNVTADDEGFLVKDAIVKGFNPYNETISGIILADWTFDSAKPNPVQVLYHTKDAQEDMENVCHVGGLVAIQAAARDGCTFYSFSFILLPLSCRLLFFFVLSFLENTHF